MCEVSEFEKARDEEAKRLEDKWGTQSIPGDWKDGANWGREWFGERGVGYLTKWLKSGEAKRNKKLEKVIRFAAGLISTMDQFKDKHPQEVEEWIYREALKLRDKDGS